MTAWLPSVPACSEQPAVTLPGAFESLLAAGLLGGCWLPGGWDPLPLVSGMEKPSLRRQSQEGMGSQPLLSYILMVKPPAACAASNQQWAMLWAGK